MEIKDHREYITGSSNKPVNDMELKVEIYCYKLYCILYKWGQFGDVECNIWLKE